MSNEGYLPLETGYATRAIHASQSPDQWNSKAVTTPIFTSSTFKLDGADYSGGFQYGRWGNPTRNNLEDCLAALDNAKYAITYSTGCAATMAALSLLKVGDHILSASDIYGGTHYLLKTTAEYKGVQLDFFDVNNIDTLDKLIKPNTKMVWVESPTNPMCRVVDIRKLAESVKKHPGVLLAMDNTFLTSYYSKPLNLGADIVMYSMTKYMNGHADVIMGALVLNDDAVFKKLKDIQQHGGAVPGPFDCYLALRGLKTLPVRMRQHMVNSIEVAKYLQTHPKVEEVIHPGLPSHPHHEVLKKQASGYSGMMAFKIKGAGEKETMKFLTSLKMVIFAGSLGGVESLAESPALLSHKYLSTKERAEVGITDNLIRLSVGIEDAADIMKDIDQALLLAFK